MMPYYEKYNFIKIRPNFAQISPKIRQNTNFSLLSHLESASNHFCLSNNEYLTSIQLNIAILKNSPKIRQNSPKTQCSPIDGVMAVNFLESMYKKLPETVEKLCQHSNAYCIWVSYSSKLGALILKFKFACAESYTFGQVEPVNIKIAK